MGDFDVKSLVIYEDLGHWVFRDERLNLSHSWYDFPNSDSERVVDIGIYNYIYTLYILYI